jgi:hypothetical protein
LILISSDLLTQVDLPDKPGVYIMRDAQGKIIYVGKAVSLKKRLVSCFRRGCGWYILLDLDFERATELRD